MIMFRDYYEHEEIIGEKRQSIQNIPEAAYREAIANAIIHREWDVNTSIRVSMFDDRVEVASSGDSPQVYPRRSMKRAVFQY